MARDRESGEEHLWQPDGGFVFIGLDPNTAFLEGTLDRDQWGFVKTSHFQHLMPNVYAVGEGAAALLAIRERLQEQSHLPAGEVNA